MRKNVVLTYFWFVLFTGYASAQVFEESGGVIKIRMESIQLVEKWRLATAVDGYTGSGYIFWDGEEYFNDTSYGRMEYKVRINNPGKYLMKWHTRVGRGTDNTEHNDTWLKIEGATDFLGMKEDGSVVRPHGICTNDCPRGSGADGYFKVYGAYHDSWAWHASTSDHDPHDIFVVFDEPGVYTIKMAARSSWHLLDKKVFYHIEMTDLESATSDQAPFARIIEE